MSAQTGQLAGSVSKDAEKPGESLVVHTTRQSRCPEAKKSFDARYDVRFVYKTRAISPGDCSRIDAKYSPVNGSFERLKDPADRTFPRERTNRGSEIKLFFLVRCNGGARGGGFEATLAPLPTNRHNNREKKNGPD